MSGTADRPGSDGPSVSGPGAVGSSVAGPSVGGPSVGGPSVGGPRVDGPRVDGPRVDRPDAGGPSVAEPGVGGPGVGVAETEQRAEVLLQGLRHSIDNLDAILVHTLAERFKCTQQVGRLKARHGLPPADPSREARQIARLETLSVEAGLDPDFARKVRRFIVDEVIRHHQRLRDD